MLVSVRRTTLETDIVASIGSKFSSNSLNWIITGIEFLDHLIVQYALHCNFNLKLCCNSDLWTN